MIASTGSNPAISYAYQAPANMKGQAVQDAAQITVMKMANDQQGQAALQLLQSVTTGKGANINVTG